MRKIVMEPSAKQKADKDNIFEKYVQLQNDFECVLNERNQLLSSRTWRVANKIKATASRLGLIAIIKFLLRVRRLGVRGALKANTILNQGVRLTGIGIKPISYELKKELMDELIKLISGMHFVGIIVAHESENCEIRDHQIQVLNNMASLGYLCIMSSDKNVKPFFYWEKDILFIRLFDYLLAYLYGQHAIIFVSEECDGVLLDKIDNHILWLDLYNDINDIELKQKKALFSEAKVITCYEPAHSEKLTKLIGITPIYLDKENIRSGLEAVETALFSSLYGLKALANSCRQGCVSVLTATFFNYDGSDFYSGGAERYLLDLNEICRDLNIRMRVYQFANYSWLRFYENLEVVGIAANGENPESHSTNLLKYMSHAFESIAGCVAAANIYSPFYLAHQKSLSPAIGISHGISWDNESNKHNAMSFWQCNSCRIQSAELLDKIISVDTNTPNWFQTVDYLVGHQMRYIPNYVDNNQFSPRENYAQVSGKIIITYPRRMYRARGLYMVLDIIDELLSQYDNIEFHFVGKGFESDIKKIERKISRWGERIKQYSCAPVDMPQIYKQSDISLIPTLHSEGTSLSCLEALSSGNAVIATRVGGLTDLIIDRYNGLLIEPSAQSLFVAIKQVLDDSDMLVNLKKKGVETARAFSKKLWIERWKDVIENLISKVAYRQPKVNLRNCVIALYKTDIMSTLVCRVVADLLKKGWTVFIAQKNNLLRGMSYERLQLIDIDEELYFQPQLSLSDQDGTLEGYYSNTLNK